MGRNGTRTYYEEAATALADHVPAARAAEASLHQRIESGGLGLRQSALAMPETTFEGQFLHGTIFEMAAAYLFHVARNHPFVDGNKRTALMCALVFLGLNGQGP